jgi:hypothetical protein
MRVWWMGQLGRYLPTGLGSIPARVVIGTRAGAERRLLVRSVAAEVVVAVIVYVAAAALLLPAGLAAPAVLIALLVATTAVRVFVRGLGTAAYHFTVMHVGVLVLRGVGLWALFHLVSPVEQPSLVAVTGALGLAGFLGSVAIFAPGGVGVREAVLVAILAGTAGPTAATAAAVAWRLLELAVELPIVAWARTLVEREDARHHSGRVRRRG